MSTIKTSIMRLPMDTGLIHNFYFKVSLNYIFAYLLYPGKFLLRGALESIVLDAAFLNDASFFPLYEKLIAF